MIKNLQKYITNISAFQFIQLIRFATLFFIGVVFSRHYSKTAIGEYETLLFVAGAVSFFWLRGVLQTFLSIVKAEHTRQNSNAIFNSALLLVIFSGFTVLFLLLFKHSLGAFLNHGNSLPFFNWLLAYMFFSAPSYLVEYIYLIKNRANNIFIYGLLSYGAQFAVMVVPPLFNMSIQISVIGLVGINALKFIYLTVLVIRSSQISVSLPFVKSHLKLAYPLIGSSLLSGSAQYIDGIIVTRFFDSATFAIYRFGARELPLVIIMANALSSSLIPDFSKLRTAEILNKLKKNATRLMHVLFPATLIFLLISNWLYPVMFTSQFAFSAKIFNIYLLLVIPRLLFPQTILIGKQKTAVLLWVSLAEVVINVSLSILLINLIGLVGVALATLAANIFERATLAFFVKSRFQIPLRQYIPVKLYLTYTIIIIAAYIVIDYYVFV